MNSNNIYMQRIPSDIAPTPKKSAVLANKKWETNTSKERERPDEKVFEIIKELTQRILVMDLRVATVGFWY